MLHYRGSRIFNKINERFLSNKSNKPLPFDQIPGPSPLPLIGNIWRYFPLIGDYKPDTLFENAQFNRKKYGTIVREKITNKLTVLHLFDPNDIEAFFRQDGKWPFRRSHRALLKYRLDRPDFYLDGGLFPENGTNWYRQRSQFQHRLMSNTQVELNSFKFERISCKAIRWMESCFIDGNPSATIENFEFFIYKWALGNSLALFLDLDIDQLEANYVDNMIQILHESLESTHKTEVETEKWIKKPNSCPHYKMLSNSQDFLYNFVSDQVENFTGREVSSEFSYLRLWLNEDKIHPKDIITFIIDALMAGLHTTSYTIILALYNIAKNSTILDLLREELQEEQNQEQGQLRKGGQLLRDCLKESLRLNPVSIGTGRLTSQENICLRNYSIPINTMVITQNQSISRDEDIYNDAEYFKPERWSDYRKAPRSQRPSPFATLPFGFGARACIGQRLAESQIKNMIAKLLKKFNIEFPQEIPVKTTMIHNIDGPVQVKLTKL